MWKCNRCGFENRFVDEPSILLVSKGRDVCEKCGWERESIPTYLDVGGGTNIDDEGKIVQKTG